jgi:carbamate kinase
MTPDAAFGHERRGTPEALADLGRERGFDLAVVPPFEVAGKQVRSADIRTLIAAGCVVISTGGGGIPVYADQSGNLVGLEAVIDKDLASSLLAVGLQADLLLISTAVERVALYFNQPQQRWLDRMTLSEARRYLAEGHFAAGSMGPKIEAIIDYLEQGGRQALITNPENITRALHGETGTWIVPDDGVPDDFMPEDDRRAAGAREEGGDAGRTD